MKLYKREVRLCQKPWTGNGLSNAPDVLSDWMPEDKGEALYERMKAGQEAEKTAQALFHTNKDHIPEVVKKYREQHGFWVGMPYFLQERFVMVKECRKHTTN